MLEDCQHVARALVAAPLIERVVPPLTLSLCAGVKLVASQIAETAHHGTARRRMWAALFTLQAMSRGHPEAAAGCGELSRRLGVQPDRWCVCPGVSCGSREVNRKILSNASGVLHRFISVSLGNAAVSRKVCHALHKAACHRLPCPLPRDRGPGVHPQVHRSIPGEAAGDVPSLHTGQHSD